MNDVAAVVFDMDGVLVDSERPSLALLERMLRAAGARHDPATVRGVCGRPAGFLRAYLVDQLGDGEHVDAFVDAFDAAKRGWVASGAIRAFPAAAGVLALLRSRGLRLALATSTHAAEARARLDRDDLLRCFDRVVTGDEVEHGKPAPDIFLLAARRLGVVPRACAVVEDSCAGVDAGRAAGMTVFALATTFPAAELAAADRVFADLDEFRAFVEGAPAATGRAGTAG